MVPIWARGVTDVCLFGLPAQHEIDVRRIDFRRVNTLALSKAKAEMAWDFFSLSVLGAFNNHIIECFDNLLGSRHAGARSLG